MNSSIENLSILVTGGGSGIGEGTARYLCAQGARVTITGRRADRLQAVAASIGEGCSWVAADVCLAADRQTALQQALQHGGGRLDALINNAGITHHSGLEGLNDEALTRVLNTNVNAPLLMTQLALPALQAAKGSVVFIGSVHSRLALPGRLAYAASKGAILTVSRVLAAELGPKGVRVNCVIPGAVATEINAAASGQDLEESKRLFRNLAALHPLGRIGEPEDIAQAIHYLLLASWTTGAVLDVDGGMGLGSTKI